VSPLRLPLSTAFNSEMVALMKNGASEALQVYNGCRLSASSLALQRRPMTLFVAIVSPVANQNCSRNLAVLAGGCIFQKADTHFTVLRKVEG